ncbi:APH(3') family aminoglycoside O-phosphotransferase [Paenibacillus yanchengensis]|uniref:APH(3') family aminoglycoside O-phosphotransferase n=1 Tax=Paenibacillus yanchengensis TaxID=2035833 RepID=A0ABW4YF33_9BACL
MLIMLPERIKHWISKQVYELDTIGMSEAQVRLFTDVVLKIEQANEESNNELLMIEWLQGKLPVPQLIVTEKVADTNYLLMSRVPGMMTCDPIQLRQPEQTIELLAAGLKLLWSVSITDCPIDNSLAYKLKKAAARVEQQLCTMEDAEETTYGAEGFANPQALLDWLIAHQPIEQMVFSHGDYCLPNIFINDNNISGFIDLGWAGIADKWQDIALCVRSIAHNFGKNPSYIDQLFAALQLEPNWEKINYYILLDELF